MKFKNAFLVGFLMMAILTIGAVSAADNITSDELAVDDGIELEMDDSVPEEILMKDDPNLEVRMPEKVVDTGMEFPETIDINLPEDIENGVATTKVYFDDVEYATTDNYADSIFLEDNFFTIMGNNFGEHTWKVEFSGDSKYNPATKEGTFIYTRLDFDLPDSIDDAYFPVKVYAPKSANGYITVKINGAQVLREKFVDDDWDDEYGIMSFSVDTKIKENAFGNYTYEIIYSGDSKLGNYSESGVFEYDYRFYVMPSDYLYIGDICYLEIGFPSDVKGKVDITLDGVTKTFDAEQDLEMQYKDLDLFNHTFTVRYYDGNYAEKTKQATVYVNEYWDLDRTVDYTQNAHVSLRLNKDAKGKIIIKKNDEMIASADFVDGVANATLPKLDIGSHEVVFEYQGNDYEISPVSQTIYVKPIIKIPEMTVGEDKYLEIQFPSNPTGNLSIKIDEEQKDVEFNNGIAKISLAYLPVNEGGHYIEIEYENGNFADFDYYNDIYVMRPLPKITVNVPELVEGVKSAFTVTAPKDIQGEISLTILIDGIYGEDWDDGYAEFSKGTATVSITPSKAGTWTLNYVFEGDEKYGFVSETINVTVESAGKISAKDLSVSYNDGSKYTVTVYDKDGKAVGAGNLVTFYAGSKKIATAKTNAKGVATYKVTLTPGTYKIKTAAYGAKITKTLKVKRILKFKAVTVKKSAKKLVLTATLAKVNKKYLKGKAITFKFNGKTYKAKTNVKGVAKVTIKSSVLKKLKVGKKITYSATYVKDTIKLSSKVKK